VLSSNAYAVITVSLAVPDVHLVLHPRYKSAYFARAKWPREWITTTEDILRNQWETYYQPSTPSES
jgi:hypothetical protein